MPSDLQAIAAFAAARMAGGRGDVSEAITAYTEAIRLAPQEPYVRLEYARLLLRLASFGRAPDQRQQRLETAFDSLTTARKLAADNLEIQREAGIMMLELGDDLPAAAIEARAALEVVRAARPDDPEVLFPLGQLYRLAGEDEKAVEALRRVTELEPGNNWVRGALERALLGLADSDLKAGKSAEAEALLREVLAGNPNNSDALVNLAELLGRRGAHAEAVTTLRALPADELSPEIRQRMVWELYMSGSLAEAARFAEGLDPKASRSAATLQILVLAARGETDAAITALQGLIGQEEKNLEVVGAVARALDGADHQQAAIELLTRMLARLQEAKSPLDISPLRVTLAQSLADQQSWKGVEETLHPLLGPMAGPPVDPHRWAAGEGWRLLYADALVNLDRAAEALRILPSATSSDPPVEGALALLGKRAEILLRLQRDAEATTELTALTTDQSADSYLQAARVYMRLQRYEDALPWLVQLTRVAPDSVEGRYFTGVAYERIGQFDSAVSSFRVVIEKSPNFAPALNYLGYLWANRGENLNEALTLVERAVALDPDNGAYLDSLGWTHFQLKQLGSARSHLERAAQLSPRDATVFEHLGDLYVALGMRDKAQEVYQKSLDLDQERSTEIRRKLQDLGGS